MIDPTSNLDVIEKLTHIIGIPGIIGVIVWLVRTSDSNKRQLTDIDTNSKAAFKTAAEIQSQVTVLQTNHMAHLQTELQDQTVVLNNIDKNIGILVDRNPRL